MIYVWSLPVTYNILRNIYLGYLCEELYGQNADKIIAPKYDTLELHLKSNINVKAHFRDYLSST